MVSMQWDHSYVNVPIRTKKIHKNQFVEQGTKVYLGFWSLELGKIFFSSLDAFSLVVLLL